MNTIIGRRVATKLAKQVASQFLPHDFIQKKEKRLKKKKISLRPEDRIVTGRNFVSTNYTPGVSMTNQIHPTVGMSRRGLSDLKGLEIAWTLGYTWSGNNILGIAQNVYFQPYGAPSSISIGVNPISPTDSFVGNSYTYDVMRHFTMRRIHSVHIVLDSLQTSSSNSGEIAIGPIRGGARVDECTTSNSSSATPVSPSQILSMSGSVAISPWQSTTLDLTPYIASGYGAKQNEFNVNTNSVSTSTVYNQVVVGTGLIPCMFVLGGTVNSSLNGLLIHRVRAVVKLDLLDFIGGVTPTNPLGITSEVPPFKEREPPKILDCPPPSVLQREVTELSEQLKSLQQKLSS